MSLRCVWVLSLSKEDFGKILHFRRFPTVEKRCQTAYNNDFVPIPPPTLLVNNLLVRLGLAPDSKQYVEWRDRADGIMQLPVCEVTVNKQKIWPVVSIAQDSYLVCCLPFLEEIQNLNKEDLLKIYSISVGFSVLLGILNFLGSEERNTSLIDLDNYLTLSMPFGKPSDVELSCVSYLSHSQSQKYLKRQPAWKPFEYKGKQLIYFKISEFVRCVQSDQSGGICHLETFGQVTVKADLESLRDVGVSLISSNDSNALSFDSLIVHPCVNIQGGPLTLGLGFPKRLRFTPPSHEIVLLQYCSSLPNDPPIHGVFKMKGEDSVELLIQLKLSAKVKNSFDYCDLIIVFFNRGPVKNFEFNANHGSPKLSEDKYTLKWSLGSKFPKDLEAVFTAKLEFLDTPILANSDPFCVDKNCYAQINFKQSNSTLTGCNIDPSHITISNVNKKIKSIVERNIQSAEYRIWNNYGDLPFSVNTVDKFNKVFL